MSGVFFESGFRFELRSVLVRLVACAAISINPVGAMMGQGPAKPILLVDQTELFDALLLTQQSGGIHDKLFNIQPLHPGQNRKVVVTLHHRLVESTMPIRFESLRRNEQSVIAELPKTPLEHGFVTTFEFILKASPHPTKANADFVVNFRTSGATNGLQFSFKGVYQDYIGFAQHEFIHSFGSNETRAQFTIPLLVTDGLANEEVVRNRLSLKVSDELSFLRTELVTTTSPPTLVGSFSPSSMRFEGEVFGDIQLLRDRKVVDEVVCFFQPKLPVEITPNRILLIPHTPDEETKFRGTAMLRMRGDISSQSISLRNIVCESPSGEPLDITWESVGQALYRLEIRVKSEASLQGSRGHLRFVIETAAGESYQIKIPFSYVNG